MTHSLLANDTDRPAPNRAGSSYLNREAGDLEPDGREPIEVRQLLKVAIRHVYSGVMGFPDDVCVAGRFVLIRDAHERPVKPPGVYSHHLDAALQEPPRRLLDHTRPMVYIVRASPVLVNARHDENYIQRLHFVIYALELRFAVVHCYCSVSYTHLRAHETRHD